MANSYIDPSLVALAAQSTGPGWEWNPGQTFVTAFNNAQENKRRNEELAMEQELAQILLPAKRAQAQYEITKLDYQSKLLEKMYNESTSALPKAYGGVMSAVGSSSDGAAQQQQTGVPKRDWSSWGRSQSAGSTVSSSPERITLPK